MLTKDNYRKAISQVDIQSLPQDFQDSHEFFLESEEFYSEDKDIKEAIDLYLQRLNEYLSFKKGNKEHIIRDFYGQLTKNEIANLRTTGLNTSKLKLADKLNISLEEVLEFDQKVRPKAKPTKVKPETSNKQTKPSKKNEPVESANQVVVQGEDVKFIKRFIGFHNKEKQLTSVLSFIKALQRAIVLKLIRKTSAYAKDIQAIQEKMAKLYNSQVQQGGNIRIQINDNDLARYVGIVGGEAVYKSVGIVKRFIGMQGKEVEQKTVDSFLKSIAKANITSEDPYFDKVQSIVDFIKKKKAGKAVQVTEQELNGFMGILNCCGCSHLGKIYDTGLKDLRRCKSQKYSDAKKGACSHHKGLKKQNKCKELNGVMTAEQVANMQYEKLALDGKWRNLIGLPATNFDMMVFGQPGSGKTTFLLQFAHYLALNFGDVLYICVEEFGSSPLTDKVNELPSKPSNLHFVKSIKGIPLQNYQFIIMDSVTDLGIDLDTYKQLREEYPESAFILILQTTKDGKFKGGKEWEHEVEIAGEIKDGVIQIYKNRYGVKGELDFFN